MTLRQLQYAAMVYRRGSLSSAAKALFVSQSALSFAIRELEEEIGITIFERSPRGMRPTEEGQAFLRKAHRALKAVEELTDQASAKALKIRIATVQSGVLPAAFSRFAAELAGIDTRYRVRCVMCENNQVIDMVESGECDIGFIYATERQEKLWRQSFPQRGIEITQIHSLFNLVIINASDPLAKASQLSFDELAGHTFVFSGEDGLDDYSNLADYSAIDFNFNEHPHYINAQDSLLLNHLLHTTKSFSLGHRSFLGRYSDGLAYIPLRDCQKVHFWILRPDGKPLDDHESRFIQLMREESARV